MIRVSSITFKTESLECHIDQLYRGNILENYINNKKLYSLLRYILPQGIDT